MVTNFRDRKPQAKGVLNALVKVLNGHDKAAQQLWYILTALRGPDSGDLPLKDVTTARIRAAIGLKPGSASGASVMAGKPDRQPAGAHFTDHINYAIDALEYFGIKPKRIEY